MSTGVMADQALDLLLVLLSAGSFDQPNVRPSPVQSGALDVLDRSSSAISVRHDEARRVGLALGPQAHRI